jgi:methionyl-tRNA formyltransferase
MDVLVRSGVELFLSAEYPWKIPVPDQLKFAINIHPTMLPDGRGPTPLPLLLLAYPQHAGITLHKMTNKFDEGEVLLQKTIKIDENESFDTLSAKLYIETPLLLNKLLSNLNHYYENGTKQGESAGWEKLTRKDQTINWNRPTSKLLEQIRAFGSLGVYSELQGQSYLITAAEGVICEHNIKAGEIISIDEIRLVIASIDGLISMHRNGLISLL